MNGQRGVITSKQGERWGVIFDDPRCGRKALKPQNLRPVALVRAACRPDDASASKLSSGLRAALTWMEKAQFDRADVAARMTYLAKHLDMGSIPAPTCGDLMIPEAEWSENLRHIAQLRPACFGSGAVDFAAMHIGARSDEERALYFREWLVSGFCAACQKEIFG